MNGCAISPDVSALLQDVLEFLEDQEDVIDYGEGKQGPNRAMSLANELRRALGEK